jgi:hypothetical protein
VNALNRGEPVKHADASADLAAVEEAFQAVQTCQESRKWFSRTFDDGWAT